MSPPRQWMDEHAIDQNLAAEVGLYADEAGTTLFAPYERADGSTFERSRKFPNGDWMQPAGEPLACWWPLGRSSGASVLVCEGEGDTLAAASILDKTDHPSLNGLCPVGLPGVGAVKVCAAELALARTRNAYICLDADEGGRRATEKLQELLPQVGVTPFPMSPGAVKDFAEVVMTWTPELREKRLAGWVNRTTPQPIERPPKPPSAPLTNDEAGLKGIPAPIFIARLTGIEPPEVGDFISCPLHDERTPSCKVNDTWFFCWGCQRGGDIYSFSMAYWNCSFREAKERLQTMFAGAGGTPSPTQPSFTNA